MGTRVCPRDLRGFFVTRSDKHEVGCDSTSAIGRTNEEGSWFWRRLTLLSLAPSSPACKLCRLSTFRLTLADGSGSRPVKPRFQLRHDPMIQPFIAASLDSLGTTGSTDRQGIRLLPDLVCQHIPLFQIRNDSPAALRRQIHCSNRVSAELERRMACKTILHSIISLARHRHINDSYSRGGQSLAYLHNSSQTRRYIQRARF